MDREKSRENRLQTTVLTALLIAVGIVIPIFFPKIVIGPASFTLASHVPIFIAMFLSPGVAVAVSLGTTLGFFLSGLPLVVTLRALTHVIFASVGAVMLKRRPGILDSAASSTWFGLLMAVIHEVPEVLVVTFFFFGGLMTKAYYSSGYMMSVLLLVGLGGVVHSMVDYSISLAVWKGVSRALRQVRPAAAARPGGSASAAPRGRDDGKK